jgi:hypothetical protein
MIEKYNLHKKSSVRNFDGFSINFLYLKYLDYNQE